MIDIVYSNLWVSFCTAFYSYGFTTHFLGKSNFVLVFFATLFVYLGQRFYKQVSGQVTIQTSRTKWMKNNQLLSKFLLLSSGIILLPLSILSVSEHPSSFWILTTAALVSFAYVVKIRKRNLREIPYIKSFLVTLVFWLVTVVLPVSHWTLFEHLFPFVAAQILVIFAIAVLFDIPDIPIDLQKTIAKRLGKNATIVLSCVLSVSFLIFLSYAFGFSLALILLYGAFVLFYIGIIYARNTAFYLAIAGDGLFFVLGCFYGYGPNLVL